MSNPAEKIKVFFLFAQNQKSTQLEVQKTIVKRKTNSRAPREKEREKEGHYLFIRMNTREVNNTSKPRKQCEPIKSHVHYTTKTTSKNQRVRCQKHKKKIKRPPKKQKTKAFGKKKKKKKTTQEHQPLHAARTQNPPKPPPQPSKTASSQPNHQPTNAFMMHASYLRKRIEQINLPGREEDYQSQMV